jgi:hypothetical protein
MSIVATEDPGKEASEHDNVINSFDGLTNPERDSTLEGDVNSQI